MSGIRHKALTIKTIAASAAVLMLTDTAAAQQVSLEEIVVTARKREESLQDVPLSITALTVEDIARRNITDLERVAYQTAGLN